MAKLSNTIKYNVYIDVTFTVLVYLSFSNYGWIVLFIFFQILIITNLTAKTNKNTKMLILSKILLNEHYKAFKRYEIEQSNFNIIYMLIVK